MKIGVVIDAACDLPRSFIDQHGIEVLPIRVHFGDREFVDVRDARATMDFYEYYLAHKDIVAETEPLSVEEIRDVFLDRYVLKYDHVLVITVASSRSPIYENATKASFAILSGYKERRKQANVEGPFSLRVIDSKTLFTGQGVLVYESLRLLEEGQLSFDQLRPAVEDFTQYLHAYLVPEDLIYVRTRARAHGDRSVSWLGYRLGTLLDIKPILQAYRGQTGPVAKVHGFDAAISQMFDMAITEIKRGLRVNVVCMSYAGNPEVVKQHPAYAKFAKVAETHGVELLLTVMSITAGINMGPGSFAIGYAAQE
ncbi:MAG TPA: DegV family protein [Gammaproteobacteria bacterium]|nr:DegV family protein [Gammaproteobacteria bacterium]